MPPTDRDTRRLERLAVEHYTARFGTPPPTVDTDDGPAPQLPGWLLNQVCKTLHAERDAALTYNAVRRLRKRLTALEDAGRALVEVSKVLDALEEPELGEDVYAVFVALRTLIDAGRKKVGWPTTRRACRA